MAGNLYFEIQVEDINRAIGFYSKTLDWEFEKASELSIEYWHIKAGSTGGGLLKRPAPAPSSGHGTNAFVCSIEVENFDETAQKILSLGGQIALPKFAVPGKCYQGYFIDTEGNTFGLFQVDLNAM